MSSPRPDSATPGSAVSQQELEQRDAVVVHDERADSFWRYYQRKETAPEERYRSSFIYSRCKLDEVLAQWIEPNGSGRALLDLGCGTGHYLRRWLQQGYNATGLDASPRMVAAARELNPPASVVQGDIYAMPFPAGSFQVVVAIELLRYLQDVPAALREVARVLQPGGEFIATVMSPFNLSAYPLVNLVTRHFAPFGLVKLRQYFHSSGRVKRLWSDAGLTPLEIRGAALVTAPQKVAERMLPGLFERSLRWLEPLDSFVAQHPALSDLPLLTVVRARRN